MISIIIPTFNSHKTIDYCLKSILDQSYKDFECLIIDYPLNNNTKNIVLNYVKKDNRFKYIVSDIKGAIAQRCKGIQLSRGEYVGFVDSDDIIPFNFYEKHIAAIRLFDADFSQCARKRFSNYERAQNFKVSNCPAVTRFVFGPNYNSLISNDIRKGIKSIALYNMVVKKEKAVSALKYYNSSVKSKYWEDAIFTYFIFYNSKNCVFMDDVFYLSINNPHSVTNNIDSSYFESTVNVSKTIFNIIKQSEYSFIKECSIYLLFGSFDYILKQKPFTKKDFIYIRNIIKNTIKIKNIKTNFSEFSTSERLLAMSLKYNLYILALVVSLKNKLYNNKF